MNGNSNGSLVYPDDRGDFKYIPGSVDHGCRTEAWNRWRGIELSDISQLISYAIFIWGFLIRSERCI